MYVVFCNKGKQYIAENNSILFIDKLNNNENDYIEFNNIILVYKDNDIIIDKEYLSKIKIIALVLKHIKGKKIGIVKFKRRKNYLKRYNHRKLITKIKICNIIL